MFNFWKKKQETKTVNKNSISIVLENNGKFDVAITYDPDNPNTAEDFAKLFYCLNKGLLMTYFIEQINSSIINDPDNSYMMLSILNKWNKLYDGEHAEKPLIKPSLAFNKNAKI